VDRRDRPFAVDLCGDDAAARLSVCDLYERFAPKGIAQGLPPRQPELRREWVEGLLGRGVNLVATRGRLTVGHAAVVDMDPGTSCEYVVFVHQDHQDLGIGTQLTEAARDLAAALGFAQLWLTVEDTNARAIRVYEKAGFRRVGSPDTELEMALDLRPGLAVLRPQARAAWAAAPGAALDG
jgi:ribosomal protein S18 acetylase RimI-like enzyme